MDVENRKSKRFHKLEKLYTLTQNNLILYKQL